ncbi:MAG: UDP-glucose 4-epimerase GalE [Bacteroidota bacterium]
MKNKVLVTGGTGYIGSHTVIDLMDNGFDVISVDNFINSSPNALENIAAVTGVPIKNYAVDLVDLEALGAVFAENEDLVGIIHFAALKSVGESVNKPWDYFYNNLNGLLNVIKCAETFAVPNLIFSSSCSVYGNTDALPVVEETPMKEAESPYARTKQMGEHILQDYAKAHPDFKTILLRYFNPAGAHESAKIGEAPTSNATNLVPVITATAMGKRKALTVFGDDYDTRDGSCVRDYIHIMDLANAHTKALQYLIANNNQANCEVFNVGLGAGATVLEAIKAFEQASGQQLDYTIGGRRAGDVVAIYANNDKATSLLGWQPKRDIEDIMRTAWEWEQVRGA